ncbi:FAD-dependent oxidoreductase [Caballeronia sp. LZ032]|uniref:NAD(P)/FAD-dependent oxidoreductase n=1 Tax=Caballeronia sp. LZ032 TaxID=3038565 RepID=UPI0028654910|nr:FAD-dependent oxidoreductase [Caballeronia sp. LZ032]MDR5879788.1 FAD-dependent oxidoreductase [Caballeronia sp. LZ032]
MNALAHVVIVGAGQAGARCAHALREFGYDGAVSLVGDEPDAPYERPPLSKAMLGAHAGATRVHLYEAARYDDARIDLLLGTRALRLRADEHAIDLDDGRTLRYDRCILATGGRARPWPGRIRGDGARLLTLRSLAHARVLRERLQQARSLIVIGGGFLGLECADAARAQGIDVTVIESRHSLLPDKLPAALSAQLLKRHEARGIRFRFGGQIKQIVDEPGKPLRVSLRDGETCDADLCLIAIGQLPNVELAAQAGLVTDTGIAVDRLCRTSAPHVYAAGDCVSFPFGETGRRVRVESWQNAEQQSRAAAANALGIETPYTLLPWFWTDQADWNMQFLGLEDPLAPDMRWIVRDGSTQNSARAVWIGLRDARPVAAVALNSGGDVTPLRKLLASGAPVEEAALADTGQRLGKLVQELISRT